MDATNVRRLGDRNQRTVRRPAQVKGVGYLTGASVRLRFLPAPPDTGIVFRRTDLTTCPAIPARFEQVTGTNRRTTLGQAPLHVSLVEHVLAALAGLQIDNCYVELNAPEPPGLDGSARGFVDALLSAGSCLQAERRAVWTVQDCVTVRQQGATLALHPARADELVVSYFLDYGMHSSLERQRRTQVVTPESFLNDIADSRTFLLAAEAVELRRQGLGPHTGTCDLLVFGPRGPIDNHLRCADEPARHKILDLIGDLSLLHQDMRGHVVAYRSGHLLNVELVRTLANSLPGQRKLVA